MAVALQHEFDHADGMVLRDDEDEWMDYDDRDMTGQDSCDGSTPAPDMPRHEY